MIAHGSVIVFTLFVIVSGHSAQRENCLKTLRANFAFIVDASDTTEHFEFEFYVKEYMNDLVRKLRIGKEHALVSVLLYSERLFLAINPERVQTLDQLLMAIRKLPHLGGPSSKANLAGAVTGTVSAAFPVRTNETLNEAVRVVILISSGRLAQSETVSDYPTEKISVFPNRLQLGHHIASIQPVANTVTLQPEAREDERLKKLGELLKSRIDYVFSIGLKGAYERGIQLLANSVKEHAFLVGEADPSYAGLSLDNFDPSLILCPDPGESYVFSHPEIDFSG
ncbi:unnamed protein product [Echinostoma caproni]|uniref:VWFA domain-containing protein n=1 Tax=Echinostoma caproni TaxID=27848 RepID=A0A183AGG3_9TREM|nr:unnamed protein product [Echinostoma caproni]